MMECRNNISILSTLTNYHTSSTIVPHLEPFEGSNISPVSFTLSTLNLKSQRDSRLAFSCNKTSSRWLNSNIGHAVTLACDMFAKFEAFNFTPVTPSDLSLFSP